MRKLCDYLTIRGDEDVLEMIDFLTEEMGVGRLDANQKGWKYIVDENLKTHDKQLLKKKLTKHFDNLLFIDLDDTETGSFYVYFSNRQSFIDLSKNETFLNIIQFFNYTINCIRDIDRKYAIYLEPTYSKDVSNDVYKVSGNICYHFTNSRNVNSILKIGLRPRDQHSQLSFRSQYPKRIYLYYKPKYQKITPDDVSFASKVVDLGSGGEIACLRVDLNKCNVPLYKDTSMDTDVAFTYSSIPPECLKEININ